MINIAFILNTLLFASSAFAFSDVPLEHVHSESILYVREYNIVNGYSDNTYKPDSGINRAEFTKIVVEATQENIAGSHCFPDVKDEWFAKYICTAKELGIIGGYPSGLFEPASPISFVEGAKVIANAFNLEQSNENEAWYTPFVIALGQQNAIPTQITSFSQPLTRGQMAEMIFRLHSNNTAKPSQTYVGLGGTLQHNDVVNSNDSEISSSEEDVDTKETQPTLPFTLPLTENWQNELNLVPIEGTEESLQNTEILEEDGENFMRVHLPKGSASRFVWKFYKKPLAGLYLWINPGFEPQDELYFSYDIRIPEDFDYGEGGSLPGMFTGIQNKRKEESTGSAFLGWDEEGDLKVSGSFQDTGTDSSTLVTSAKLPADGQWHTIDMHLRLQTQAGRGNGQIEVYLDGERIQNNTNVIFRNRTGDKWDALAPGATYGDISVNSMVQEKDLHIDFKNYSFRKK